METTKIVRVVGLLNKNRYAEYIREIEVVEKNKCYDTLNKPKRRFRKTRLGVLETDLKNSIAKNQASTISYSILCKPQDIEKYKKVVKNEVRTLINSYKEDIDKMVSAIEK